MYAFDIVCLVHIIALVCILFQLDEEETEDDIDRDPWKDSRPANPPVSPAPGGFPSPRRISKC